MRAIAVQKIYTHWSTTYIKFTFNMSPMLHTNVPGIGGADIHSPDRFFTFNNSTQLKIEIKEKLH